MVGNLNLSLDYGYSMNNIETEDEKSCQDDTPVNIYHLKPVSSNELTMI